MNARVMVPCLVGFLAIAAESLLVLSAQAEPLIPERRRSQFQNDSGYAVFPYVFDVPGIGAGYGVLGVLNNIRGSCTDVGGTLFDGDARGQALGIESVHLIPKTLILDVGVVSISRVAIRSYSQRGVETEEDDYSEAELSDLVGGGARLTATFMDRRLEAYYGYYGSRARLSALRDSDGNLIVEADGMAPEWGDTHVIGGRVDLTDDYLDPRRGLRFEPSVWWAPPQADTANYFFVDGSLTVYVPVGKRSTWASNFLCSDAYVLEKGETDPVRVAERAGLRYDEASDPRERQYVDNVVVANTYGNATSLGGFSRLRSYPEMRYNGAHTQFFGTEFRWNLTDEMKPFNLLFVRDVRTAVQVAPFYEIGTVVDKAGDLWEATRSSYGVGLRVVTASGLIYRFDIAVGHEGMEPSVFFQYPWEL